MSLHFHGTVDLGRFLLDVDFRAQPGEVLALLGPNGCGKSTSLAAIAGLRRLTSGSIRIGGEVVDEPARGLWVPPHLRRTGFVFQTLELFPHMSVLDNVAYGLRRREMTKQAARARASEWLDVLGAGALAAERPVTLSGGQAQRVAIARALAIEPDVLLLDEPMSALDAESRLAIRGELRRRLDAFDGITVLVTHDLIDVVGLADRVIVLDEGRVIQDATPEQLRRHPLSSHAAALVGRNVLRGERVGATIHLNHGVGVEGPPGPDGPVDVVCSPMAVHVVPMSMPRPSGAWQSRVIGVEAVGDHARAHLGPPMPITARISMDALDDDLALDSLVWVRLDAASLDVYPVDTGTDTEATG